MFRDIDARDDGPSGEIEYYEEGDLPSDLIDDRMTKSQLRAMATMGSKSGRMQGRRGERRDETDEYEYESDEYEYEILNYDDEENLDTIENRKLFGFSDLAALCVRVFSDLKVEDIGYVTKTFKNILDGLDASFASNIIIYIRGKMGGIVDQSEVRPADRINRDDLAEMYKEIRRQVVCLLVGEYQKSTQDFDVEIEAGEASKYPPLFETVGVFLNVMLPYTIVAYVWLSFIRFFDAPETVSETPQSKPGISVPAISDLGVIKEEYISQFLSILRTFIIYFNDLENFHKQTKIKKIEGPFNFEHTELTNPEFKDFYVDRVSDIRVSQASGYVSAMLTRGKKQSVFINEDDPGLLKDADTAKGLKAFIKEIDQRRTRRIIRSTQDGQDGRDAQISRFAVFDEKTSNRRFGKHTYLRGNLGGDFSLETCQDERHFEILDENFVFGLLSIVNSPVVYLNLEIMNEYHSTIKQQSSHSGLFRSYWETRYRVRAVDEKGEPAFNEITRGDEQILEPLYEAINLANILGFYIVNPLAYQYMACLLLN